MKQFFRGNNEKGYVLVTAMLLLVVLTFIGIAAQETSRVELQITGNDRVYRTDFYNQEVSLTEGNLNYRDWLTTAYLTSDEDEAYFPKAGTDTNNDGITDECEIFTDGKVIGSYRVRNNVTPASNINDWEDLDDFDNIAANHPANQIPELEHIDKPLPGSGYDPKNFEIRRFTITAYSPNDDRKAILQEGVYKVFNKY